MSKTHYLDENKTLEYTVTRDDTRYQYKTSCGLVVGLSFVKLLDDEVFMTSSVDHVRDKSKVTCENCKQVLKRISQKI